MKSDTAQPPEKSALDLGWEDQNGLSPVYFVTQKRLWKFFSTVFFPIPKNEDVVSQSVKACTAGNNLHTRGPC
jgi:hypothetical protein